jgi:uncharacterized membrane protein
MNPRPMIAAGTMLGIGLGGFIDGILFHQLMQIHEMLSARVPPLTLVNAEINMFWDGLFHAGTWLATAVGLWMCFEPGLDATCHGLEECSSERWSSVGGFSISSRE